MSARYSPYRGSASSVVDQSGAAILAGVGQEAAGLFGRGNDAVQVEIDPAEELGVVGRLRRGNTLGLQSRLNVPVDEGGQLGSVWLGGPGPGDRPQSRPRER